MACATVSVASAGVEAPVAVSMVFVASAKTGASFAISSGAISTVGTVIVKGVETQNVEETVKQALLAGSDGFKFGAIAGVVTVVGYQKAYLWLNQRGAIPPQENQN